jgi:transposase InsO family protein
VRVPTSNLLGPEEGLGFKQLMQQLPHPKLPRAKSDKPLPFRSPAGCSRRHIVWIGVTNSPTAEWIARQITEAFPWDSAPGYLIRDRDCVFGSVLKQRLRAMGIRDKPIAPRSPWQNGFVERLIGSIRRECLDHIIVFGEEHLRRVLQSYASYYNRTRTHRSLDKGAPVHRPVQRIGALKSRPILGGLHHQYIRI